jgi:hypothetical protein
METVEVFAAGITALAVGHVVGLAANSLARKIELHRSAVTGTDKTDDSLFDDLLDVSLEVALLLMGIKATEKMIPSVISDSGALILFQVGLVLGQDGLPKKINSIRKNVMGVKKE